MSSGEIPASAASEAWDGCRRRLHAAGLNLTAVLDAGPGSAARALLDAAGVTLPGRRLVLIGSGGEVFWRVFSARRPAGAHPVDDYSRAAVGDAFAAAGLAAEPLYPLAGAPPAPLQRLGALAGWHHESPLGLGVHPDYGPWFAYRAALLTSAALPLGAPPAGASPCDGCAAPCVAACPAGALRADAAPAMPRCFDYRLRPASRCEAQCLSRLACPVANERRYPHAQIDYHYRYLRNLLRRVENNGYSR